MTHWISTVVDEIRITKKMSVSTMTHWISTVVDEYAPRPYSINVNNDTLNFYCCRLKMTSEELMTSTMTHWISTVVDQGQFLVQFHRQQWHIKPKSVIRMFCANKRSFVICLSVFRLQWNPIVTKSLLVKKSIALCNKYVVLHKIVCILCSTIF